MVTEVSSPALTFVPHRGRGVILILTSSVCFGVSGTIAKPAMLAGLSPEQVAAARIGLAALILMVMVAVFRPGLLRVRRSEWPLLFGYGLLAVGGVQLCYFISAERLPVGIAILLEFTSPVLIALWTRFVRRTRLPRVMWFGIALAMLGLTLVAQIWSGLRLDSVGLLAGLGGALCSASYFLLGEHGVTTRAPLGILAWGMTIGAVAVCALAPPWQLPGAVLLAPARLGPWRPPVWLLLVALAVIATVLAYLLGIAALRHLPAPVASVLGLCELLVTVASAWALLGEALAWIQALGTAAVVGGAVLVQLNSPKPVPGTATAPARRE